MKDVQEARRDWHGTIHHKGGHCPVCERWGRVYWRSINKTMAKDLIWLCSQAGDVEGWVYLPRAPQWVVRSNQLSTLKNWGLVERRANTGNPKVKHEGFWRPTDSGWAFFHGQIKVPRRVATYNDTVVDTSRDRVGLRECFKDVFDYEETMRSTK